MEPSRRSAAFVPPDHVLAARHRAALGGGEIGGGRPQIDPAHPVARLEPVEPIHRAAHRFLADRFPHLSHAVRERSRGRPIVRALIGLELCAIAPQLEERCCGDHDQRTG